MKRVLDEKTCKLLAYLFVAFLSFWGGTSFHSLEASKIIMLFITLLFAIILKQYMLGLSQKQNLNGPHDIGPAVSADSSSTMEKETIELYEKLYFHEIDVREKLNSRSQTPLTIISAFIWCACIPIAKF